MIRKKHLLTMSCNLIGHPYITLDRQCISGRKFSQNDLKNVRCQTVIIVCVIVRQRTCDFFARTLYDPSTKIDSKVVEGVPQHFFYTMLKSAIKRDLKGTVLLN